MKAAIQVLLFFLAGILFAYYGIVPIEISNSKASTYTLYVLLIAAGMSLGFDLKAWGIVRKLKFKILVLPFGIILGSLLGSIFATFIFSDLTSAECMSVASGLGWYSLTSAMITEHGDPALGSIGLLANILREVSTLAITPLLVKYVGKVSPIATCGAASMDTCLPLIVRYSGEAYAIISVFSGMCLTFAMPLLLPLFLSLI